MHRVWRRVLYYVFGFDKWHLAILSDRKYAKDIITYLNAYDAGSRKAAVEIGCGLGEIIRHLDYEKRLGLDADDHVLRAASFVARMKGDFETMFRLFHFPTDELSGRFNVIIMVNWIHHVPPVILKGNIKRYFETNLTEKGTIIIDTVQSNQYEFNHSVQYLAEGLSCSIWKLGDYEAHREIFALSSYDKGLVQK